MIYIYSDITIKKNQSKGPTGLLKWIVEVLKKNQISYLLTSNPYDINKFRNQNILIYPAKLFLNLSKKTRSSNKIITLGPDSYTTQIYSLILFYIPILRRILSNFYIKKTLCIIFDDLIKMNKFTNFLIGFNDTNFLNSVGGRYIELPHPFLSSVNLTKPILPDKLRNNDFVLIGKLKGLPVGFRNLEKSIEKHLLPAIESSQRSLYIFESTGLNLRQKSKSYKNVKFISRSKEIPDDFFKSKIILNLGICGGGTANRSLSALYDGAYLFSTSFGARNLELKLYKDRIKISKYSPFQRQFYKELLNCEFSKINLKNIDDIEKNNNLSEFLLLKSFENKK